MKNVMTLILLLAALTASNALASGSSVPRSSGFPSSGEDPLLVTETVKCIVVEIQDDGKIIVRDLGKQEPKILAFTKKTRFQAQNKKAFQGRKKLQAADLQVGHKLKVTMRPATGEVTKVRVLKRS